MLAEYRRCLYCDVPTWMSDSSEPMDVVEARSIASHVRFDAYCVERDAAAAKDADDLIEVAFTRGTDD